MPTLSSRKVKSNVKRKGGYILLILLVRKSVRSNLLSCLFCRLREYFKWITNPDNTKKKRTAWWPYLKMDKKYTSIFSKKEYACGCFK